MNEVVPVHLRGGLVDIHAVMLVFGYVIAGWVGFGFFFWKSGGANTWRPPLAIQCLAPLLLLTGLYWVPESPRWLIMKGRHEEAKIILEKLHSDKNNPDNDYARAEFYQIQKQIYIDNTLGSSWYHMFKKPSYRKRAFLAMATTSIISCSGVLVINSESCVSSSLYSTILISS
jgi:MFS family permease